MPRDGEERIDGTDDRGRPVVLKYRSDQDTWFRKTNRGRRGGDQEKRREYFDSQVLPRRTHRGRSRTPPATSTDPTSEVPPAPKAAVRAPNTQTAVRAPSTSKAAPAPATPKAAPAPAPQWLKRGNSTTRQRPDDIPEPPNFPPPKVERRGSESEGSYTYTESPAEIPVELDKLPIELQERARRAQEAQKVAQELELEAASTEQEVVQVSKKARLLRTRADLAKEESQVLDKAFTTALAKEQAAARIKQEIGISKDNQEVAAPSVAVERSNQDRSPIPRTLSRTPSSSSIVKPEVQEETRVERIGRFATRKLRPGESPEPGRELVKEEPKAESEPPVPPSSEQPRTKSRPPVKAAASVKTAAEAPPKAAPKGTLTAPIKPELRRQSSSASDKASGQNRDQVEVILTIDYNDTLAVPDPACRSGRPPLIIPQSHTDIIKQVLKRGVKVVVLSFAVKRANEVKRAIRNWELYDQLHFVDIVNQRSGSSFYRDFVDDDHRDPGYTSGGKDFYLASRGWVTIVDDSDEVTTACERQGIQTYRIRTQREDHPKRPAETQGHWAYNRGIFSGFCSAIEAFIDDIDKNRHQFATYRSFWNPRKYVKWQYRHSNHD